MKLSIFTTVTSPNTRGDNIYDANRCFGELADEVVVIDGSMQGTNYDKKWCDDAAYSFIKREIYEWPKEFDWPFIGQQFQRGYEHATGDWVIHADLDFIFHENDFADIRKAIEENNDAPALSFWKYQFVQPDRYNLKSRLVIAVNKGKFGNRIRFDSGGDLCQPSLDGKKLSPDEVPEARAPFYNYEKLIKTKEQIVDDVERMDRAYERYFGKPLYSNGSRSAFDGWMEMAIGRYHKPSKEIDINEHPKYMQETIKNLKPEQFGYNAFGILRENNYVKSR